MSQQQRSLVETLGALEAFDATERIIRKYRRLAVEYPFLVDLGVTPIGVPRRRAVARGDAPANNDGRVDAIDRVAATDSLRGGGNYAA